MIDGLVALGDTVGEAPRVFGALLWQHVTGLPYLTAQSDLDLLWSGADAGRVRTLVAGLSRLDGDSPVRIDGEVELPDGAASHWRELADDRGNGMVLLKTMNGVETRASVRLFQASAPP